MPNFGDYETGRPIGISGKVLRAKLHRAKSLFVIKFSPPHLKFESADKLFRAALFQQVIAAKLRSLAPVHRCGESAEEAWFATDFYPSTVDRLITEGTPFSAAELSHLTISIAQALLQFRKAAGRWHGNVKPGNLMLTSRRSLLHGRVVLSDPAPDLDVDEQTAARRERQALGRVIYELITRTPFRDPFVPCRPSAKWKRLGEQASQWCEWCNALLDPQSELTLEQLVTRIREARPGTVRKFLGSVSATLVIVGMMIAAVALIRAKLNHQNSNGGGSGAISGGSGSITLSSGGTGSGSGTSNSTGGSGSKVHTGKARGSTGTTGPFEVATSHPEYVTADVQSLRRDLESVRENFGTDPRCNEGIEDLQKKIANLDARLKNGKNNAEMKAEISELAASIRTAPYNIAAKFFPPAASFPADTQAQLKAFWIAYLDDLKSRPLPGTTIAQIRSDFSELGKIAEGLKVVDDDVTGIKESTTWGPMAQWYRVRQDSHLRTFLDAARGHSLSAEEFQEHLQSDRSALAALKGDFLQAKAALVSCYQLADTCPSDSRKLQAVLDSITNSPLRRAAGFPIAKLKELQDLESQAAELKELQTAPPAVAAGELDSRDNVVKLAAWLNLVSPNRVNDITHEIDYAQKVKVLLEQTTVSAAKKADLADRLANRWGSLLELADVDKKFDELTSASTTNTFGVTIASGSVTAPNSLRITEPAKYNLALYDSGLIHQTDDPQFRQKLRTFLSSIHSQNLQVKTELAVLRQWLDQPPKGASFPRLAETDPVVALDRKTVMYNVGKWKIKFKQVSPAGGQPVYLSTTEISVGIAAELYQGLGDAEKDLVNHSAKSVPAGWRITNGNISESAGWWGPTPDDALDKALNDIAPNDPSRRTRLVPPGLNIPMQNISASGAMELAHALKFDNGETCTLPTVNEWQAAVDAENATAKLQNANLPGRRLADYVENVKAKGGAVNLADVQLHDGNLQDATRVYPQPGILLFGAVPEPGDDDDFHDLIGNVAEWVTETRNGTVFKVIGGSSLCCPTGVGGKADPLKPVPPKNKLGMCDVGFRLAMPAPHAAQQAPPRLKYLPRTK